MPAAAAPPPGLVEATTTPLGLEADLDAHVCTLHPTKFLHVRDTLATMEEGMAKE